MIIEVEDGIEELVKEKSFKDMLLGYTDYDLKIAHYNWLLKKADYDVKTSNLSGMPHGTGYVEGRK